MVVLVGGGEVVRGERGGSEMSVNEDRMDKMVEESKVARR